MIYNKPSYEKVDFLMYELQKWLQKRSSGSKSTKNYETYNRSERKQVSYKFQTSFTWQLSDSNFQIASIRYFTTWLAMCLFSVNSRVAMGALNPPFSATPTEMPRSWNSKFQNFPRGAWLGIFPKFSVFLLAPPLTVLIVTLFRES